MIKFKHSLAICVLFASVLFGGALVAQEPAFPLGDFSALRETGRADVLQVLSPQTLKLSSGEIIYLSGIIYTDSMPEAAGPFSVTALKILQDMLEGERVIVYQTPKKNWGRTNRLGHALAHIVREKDDAWAQGTLVGLGLAAVRTTQRTPEMALQLYDLEAFARQEKRGIWAERFIVQTPESAGKHLNSFQIVEGPIESVALKKNRLYLNFGGNWRDDFTVSIAPENKRFFTKAGVNPLDWNGQRVRVRGWVEEYNGAYIEIDHPEAIELLDSAKPPSE